MNFAPPHDYVGVVTYGLGAIAFRTAESYIPEFEQNLPDERLTIEAFSNLLKDFFLTQFNEIMPAEYQGPPLAFNVAGFNVGEPYGRVYDFFIPTRTEIQEKHPGGFGIAWGGQRGIVDRLIKGYDERIINVIQQTLEPTAEQMQTLTTQFNGMQMAIPAQFLALQDCIDLGIFFVRTTIEAQRLTVMLRGCGGPIDVATITRLQGFKWVQEKKLRGEPWYNMEDDM